MKIIAAGDFTYESVSYDLLRFNNDGSLDLTFSPGAFWSSGVNTISMQTDGKIIVGGSFDDYNETEIYDLARLTAEDGGGGGTDPDASQSGTNQLSATIAQNMTLSCGGDIDLNGGSPLIPQTPATSQTTCTVTTNDENGYDLQLTNDRGLHNTLYHTTQSTTADGQITDKSRWNPSSPNATTFTGTGLAFGILTSTATKNTAWWGTGTTCADTNQLYAGIPATSTAIMEHTDYSNTPTDTTICYQINVPSTQISGLYEGSVTYTATGRP